MPKNNPFLSLTGICISVVSLFILGVILLFSQPPPAEIVAVPPPDPGNGLIADPGSNKIYIPPRHAPGRSPALSTFTVNWNPASCVGVPTPWPAPAQAAFQFAVDIWEMELVSAVPIAIDACWVPIGDSVLGTASTTNLARNFAGAPQPNTWYTMAQANTLTQTDYNGAESEIVANFSSQLPNWYFGTDGNGAFNEYDFVTVVLHELGHGLGFSGSMQVANGIGSYGFANNPVSFDRLTENSIGMALVEGAIPNNSAALGTQLRSGNVFFDGSAVRAANSNAPAELYAPATWVPGSSYAHLDDLFDNTSSALMTHSILNGEAIHNPGAVTLALLQDIGWQLASAPQATITPGPSPSPTNIVILVPTFGPTVTPPPPVKDDTTLVYLPLVVR